MIPHKPHHKGFKRPDPKKSWGRKTPSAERKGDKRETILQRTGLRPFGKSNRSKDRSGHQRTMTKLYAHETTCAFRGCKEKLGMGHAHRLKKRFLTEMEWIHGQVKLCFRHHHYCEYGDLKHKGTHRRMWRLITVLMRQQGRPFDELDGTLPSR